MADEQKPVVRVIRGPNGQPLRVVKGTAGVVHKGGVDYGK